MEISYDREESDDVQKFSKKRQRNIKCHTKRRINIFNSVFIGTKNELNYPENKYEKAQTY